MEKQTADLIKPHLALLAIQFMFGTLPVVGKYIMLTIPPFALVGFRIGITAAILLTIQQFKGGLALYKKQDYWRFFLLSFVGVSVNQLFFIGGLSLTKASNTSILAVTIPIFTLIIGAIFGIEKLRLIKVFGIVLAACGVIILIDPRRASFSSETTLGDILVILNSLCYGIYVVISKDIFIRNGAIKSTAWIFTFASLLCVPLGIYSLSSIEISTINLTTWLAILQISIISTTMPYLLISWTLARVNPSTVAVYVYMQPLIGFCMAVIFLNESFTISTIISAILIFTGVYFASKKRQNKEMK